MQTLEVLELLESNGSRLFKEKILKDNYDNEFLKRILLAAQNPYVHYGVAKFKMPPAGEHQIDLIVNPNTGEKLTHSEFLFRDFVDDLLPKLATRDLKGNAARNAVESSLSRMPMLTQKWCKRILLQNLRAGIQSSTINKVWPDLIPGFVVQLAHSLQTSYVGNQIQIDEIVNYPIRAEPKLDGLRCVAIKNNGVVTLFTRNGRQIDTLPTIKNALEKSQYDNIVLDGECMGEDWNESASIVGSKKNKKSDNNIVFNVFDAVSFNDWLAQCSKSPFVSRLELLNTIVSRCSGPIKAVEGRLITSKEELLAFYEECLDDGFEGIMLKDLTSIYEFKRSRSIKKMKPMTTYEGVIIDHYEGRDGTKNKGEFGGFVMLLENGVSTRVGSGFTDAERTKIKLNDPNSYIGQVVEVEGQPPLTKDGRVRFPVFQRYRDESDVDPNIFVSYETWLKNNVHTMNASV